MLTISNRQRILQVMDEALQMVEGQAVYYNLQKDEEVTELLGQLQTIRAELQQKNEEAFAKLEQEN